MVLAACVLASSMAFIDGSALIVTLPRLRADFGARLASVQWVLNGYVLALASLTLIGGSLADVYCKARMLGFGYIVKSHPTVTPPSSGANSLMGPWDLGSERGYGWTRNATPPDATIFQ